MTADDLDAALANMSDSEVTALLMRRMQTRATRKRDQTASRMARLRERAAGGAQNGGSDAKVTPGVTQEKRHSSSKSDAASDAKVTPQKALSGAVKEAGSFPLNPQSPEETSTLRKKTPSGEKKEVPPPENSAIPHALQGMEGFAETWTEFVESRRQIKHPITPLAAARLLKVLAQRPGDAVAGLNLAIEKQWRGFNWQWLENSRAVKPIQTGQPTADVAELGNARMAFYTETGKPPFGKSDAEVLSWYTTHLAKQRAA